MLPFGWNQTQQFMPSTPIICLRSLLRLLWNWKVRFYSPCCLGKSWPPQKI